MKIRLSDNSKIQITQTAAPDIVIRLGAHNTSNDDDDRGGGGGDDGALFDSEQIRAQRRVANGDNFSECEKGLLNRDPSPFLSPLSLQRWTQKFVLGCVNSSRGPGQTFLAISVWLSRMRDMLVVGGVML